MRRFWVFVCGALAVGLLLATTVAHAEPVCSSSPITFGCGQLQCAEDAEEPNCYSVGWKMCFQNEDDEFLTAPIDCCNQGPASCGQFLACIYQITNAT